MNETELNSKGTNKAIKANILSDEEMLKIGFTNRTLKAWYFCREIEDLEISFNVTIPVDGSDIEIITLDEDFCQPYDYQYILERNPDLKVALIVKDRAEGYMTYLCSVGVLSGWEKGMYI